MTELEQVAMEVYNKQAYEEKWGGFNWEIAGIKADLQGFLDTLDSFWYVEDFDRDELINKIDLTIKLFNEMKEKSYEDGWIQLSAERTLWKCNTDGDETLDEYSLYVEDAIEQFKDTTGVDVVCLGRNGRHVCVANEYQNAVRYNELCEIQAQLEKWVIENYNNRRNN